METAKKPKLTPHQRESLIHLIAVQSRAGHNFHNTSAVRWASLKDTGSKGAMEHLVDKGYAARRVERGPLGGELLYYAPTILGIDEAARIRERGLKTGGR